MDRRRGRILVTGASGFVGRWTCRHLLERGHAVRAAIRSNAARERLVAGVEPWRVPDHARASAWREPLQDVDAVVHLVARTHVLHERADVLEEYRRVNVGVTDALLRAAVAGGVRRFVYASSIKAVGESQTLPCRETDECRPEDAYGITKREAERLVFAHCRDTGTEAVVFRCPLVHGPGVRGNFLRLLRAVHRGALLPLGRVRARRSMVYVENLADAIGRLVEHPRAANCVFHVADEPALELRHLVRRLARLLGRPCRLLPVPPGLLRQAGTLLGRTGEVRRLTEPLIVDSQRIREELDWTSPVSLECGLSNTVRAYLDGQAGRADAVRPAPRDAA